MNTSQKFQILKKTNVKLFTMIPYATIDKNQYFGETVKNVFFFNFFVYFIFFLKEAFYAYRKTLYNIEMFSYPKRSTCAKCKQKSRLLRIDMVYIL